MPPKKKSPKVFQPLPGLKFLQSDRRKYPWLDEKNREYVAGKELGDGAYGTTYMCEVKDWEAKSYPREACNLVLKVPKVASPEVRNRDQTEERLNKIKDRAFLEFEHISRRLQGFRYANRAIDIIVTPPERGHLRTVTIQPFVDDKWDLDRWAVKDGVRNRQHPAVRDQNRQLKDNCTGISDLSKWLDTALRIARSLEGLHRRRVIHGDIHPGNVMLGTDKSQATLIDFGESMLCYPNRNRDKKRIENPYLAPERADTRGPIYEWVDVYSFGILMLYLATGKEIRLTSDEAKEDGKRYPGRLRSYLYELIEPRNADLVRKEPRILDLIGKCTANDSADRPRMVNVCDDLERIRQTLTEPARLSTFGQLTSALTQIGKKFKPTKGGRNRILTSLLHKKVSELQETADSLETEMVEFFGTREQLLRTLISIFEHLDDGDSWTTLTTLGVWHRGALGLDGSYGSATVQALRANAAVRRTFAVSVEELGKEGAVRLRDLLKDHRDPALNRLGQLLETAIGKYRQGKASEGFIQWHQERLEKMLAVMGSLIRNWNLKPTICPDGLINIKESRGLYLGICPVANLDDADDLRDLNPASLLYLRKERKNARKWLLMMTIVQRRCEDRSGMYLSHLVGVRVFESQMGVPEDRIRELQTVMNEMSVNVAGSVEELHRVVHEVYRKKKTLRGKS